MLLCGVRLGRRVDRLLHEGDERRRLVAVLDALERGEEAGPGDERRLPRGDVRDEVGRGAEREGGLALARLLGRRVGRRRDVEERGVQGREVRRREGQLGARGEDLVEVGRHVGRVEVLERGRRHGRAVELVAPVHDADLGRRARLGREREAHGVESSQGLGAHALVAVGEGDDEARDDDLPVDELALGRGRRRGEDLDERGGVAQGGEAQLDRDGARRRGVDRGEEREGVVRHERAKERLEDRRGERVRRRRRRVGVREAVRREAQLAVGDLDGRRRRREPGPARVLERVDGLERADEERGAQVLLRLVGRRLGEGGVLDRGRDGARVGRVEQVGGVLGRGGDETVEARLLHLERLDDGDDELDAAALLELAGEAERDEERERERLALRRGDLGEEERDGGVDGLAARAGHVLGDDLDDLVGRGGRHVVDRVRQRGRDALEPDVRLLELGALERVEGGEARARVGLGDEEARPEDALDDGVGVRRVLLHEAAGEVRQDDGEVVLLVRAGDGGDGGGEDLLGRDVRLEDGVVLLGEQDARDVLLRLGEARDERVVHETGVALLDDGVGVLEDVAQGRDADRDVGRRGRQDEGGGTGVVGREGLAAEDGVHGLEDAREGLLVARLARARRGELGLGRPHGRVALVDLRHGLDELARRGGRSADDGGEARREEVRDDGLGEGDEGVRVERGRRARDEGRREERAAVLGGEPVERARVSTSVQARGPCARGEKRTHDSWAKVWRNGLRNRDASYWLLS